MQMLQTIINRLAEKPVLNVIVKHEKLAQPLAVRAVGSAEEACGEGQAYIAAGHSRRRAKTQTGPALLAQAPF